MMDTSEEPVIRKSQAFEGTKWISQSFSIFAKSPSIWVVIFMLYVAINLLLTSTSYLVLLPTLLAPIFNAGFVYGARSADNEEMIQIDHLFYGFKLQFRNLFRLGVLFFIMNVMILVLLSIYIESAIDEDTMALLNQATNRYEVENLLLESPELLATFLKALMLGLMLSIPLIMASWFAPALVMFNQLKPLPAILLSIKACNNNMLPFTVYGVLMLPLILLALMPFGLGLLIIFPVIIISQYVSYKSIFNQQQKTKGVFIV